MRLRTSAAIPATSLLSLLLMGTPALQGAESTPAKSLLVLSKSDRTLSIVEPVSLKVLARMPSGPDPHEVVASPDGRFAYISNYGGGAYNTITVVDLVGQRTVGPVDLGPLRGPHGLMFAAGKVWFTAEAAKVIGSLDPASNKVDLVLGTGQDRTHMIYVLGDGQRILTSNVGSASMTVIDRMTPSRPPASAGGPAPGGAQTNWQETVIPVGRGAEGFDVDPAGKELWAANAQDGTISIVDLSNKKVTATLDANVTGANRLKFTNDGKMVFVSTLRGPDVAVFDTSSRKEIKRIKVGTGAAGILMHPDGTKVYVACTPDSYVVVVDTATLENKGRFEAGKQPDGLAWASR